MESRCDGGKWRGLRDLLRGLPHVVVRREMKGAVPSRSEEGFRLKRCSMAGCLVLIAGAATVRAEVVSLSPAKDNTLYESPIGDLSNGSGSHVFTGRTVQIFGSRRRALIAFDLIGIVPPESTLNRVTLRLYMSRSLTAEPITNTLHRVLSDWGEGDSVAPGLEGAGGPARPDDATWLHAFFPVVFWTTAGGDSLSTASAATPVFGVGEYVWSTDQMLDDLQFWLDDPSRNFGWLVKGDESTSGTARRFDSLQHSSESRRPELIIDFTPPPEFACCLPSGACEVLFETQCTNAGGNSLPQATECEGDGDADGVDAACGDDCPQDQEKVEPGLCGCGLDDEADEDGDQVPDCIDRCPGADDHLFAPECEGDIPAISTWGAFILALLILVVSKVRFGLRSRPAGG